jgi:hypothetical protein
MNKACAASFYPSVQDNMKQPSWTSLYNYPCCVQIISFTWIVYISDPFHDISIPFDKCVRMQAMFL